MVPFASIRSFEPMPLRRTCSFRYAASFVLTTGNVNVFGTEYMLRPNSLYDPDLTSTGHQPYGYDQMHAFYDRYRVLGFDLDIVFTNPNVDGLVVAATVQPSSSTFALAAKSIEQVTEQPNSAVAFINNTGSQRTLMRKSFDVATVEGLSKAEFAGALSYYWADFTNNPSLTPYVRIAAADLITLGGGNTINAVVTLVMRTELSARRVLAQS